MPALSKDNRIALEIAVEQLDHAIKNPGNVNLLDRAKDVVREFHKFKADPVAPPAFVDIKALVKHDATIMLENAKAAARSTVHVKVIPQPEREPYRVTVTKTEPGATS